MSDKSKYLADRTRIERRLAAERERPRPIKALCHCRKPGEWQIGNRMYCADHVPAEDRALAGLPPFPKGDGHTPWAWVHCSDYKCGYRKPLPLVPYMIRFQTADPLPRLRKCLVCPCGKRGATFIGPSPLRASTLQPWAREQFPHDWPR